MNTSTRSLGVLGLVLLAAGSCGGAAGTKSPTSSSSSFFVVEAFNGFGQLLPYEIAVVNSNGTPSNSIIQIRTVADLVNNTTRLNPVRQPATWVQAPQLPDGRTGNHFLAVRFSQPPAFESALSNTTVGGLGASLALEVVDPGGAVRTIGGRAFLGGRTFGPTPGANPGELALETWVALDSAGNSVAVPIDGQTPGVGFPGTESGFAGAADLLDPSVLVFVVDTDGNLATPDMFPEGAQIQLRIETTLRSARGRALREPAVASSTVGPDRTAPELLVRTVNGLQESLIIPGNNEQDVDPQTNIEVHFSEPVQLRTLGVLDESQPAELSPVLQIQFGPSANLVNVPFHIRPRSHLDLATIEMVPVYSFPGRGPVDASAECGGFSRIDITLTPLQLPDLATVSNFNSIGRQTAFFTREGPGIVNAPVSPDTIYVGRTGSNQGISVIDLNGFGGGTGNPTFDPLFPIRKGNSNFPNNPNLLNGSQLIPPLQAGTCTFNGGSEGIFTLTKDTSLRDVLIGRPTLESVGDMALGHALDNVFSNETFGCQSGGGNICAQSGLKQIQLIPGGPNTVAPASFAALPPIKSGQGVENLICWSPHPNPPPLSFPPLCLDPLIAGLEPTSITTTVVNALSPGPLVFGIPEANQPPGSLLSTEQNVFFEGPSLPQSNIAACAPFSIRQQIGQFLYVIDRVAGEIVVLNSNRFTVLDRIRLPDPTSLAMSPNLDFLAVTNEGADQVSFIDVNPASASFHSVVRTARVGAGPTGIAWEPGNEDIFVCNQAESTVSIISAFSLQVRKVLRNQINRPIEVAITPRQDTFGFLRDVYFAYILNQGGRVAFFESGPDGLNGIGYDDVITTLPFVFARPKAIQPDISNTNSAVWIAHEQALDENGQPLPNAQAQGAISNVAIVGGRIGQLPLDPGLLGSPTLREMEFGVLVSIGQGSSGLSGIPVDMAFDNLRNYGALQNGSSRFSAGAPLAWNGKATNKLLGGVDVAGSAPQFLFLAVPNPGVIDVFDLSTTSNRRVDTDVFLPGVQSIPAPSAGILMDYFRQ